MFAICGCFWRETAANQSLLSQRVRNTRSLFNIFNIYTIATVTCCLLTNYLNGSIEDTPHFPLFRFSLTCCAYALLSHKYRVSSTFLSSKQNKLMWMSINSYWTLLPDIIPKFLCKLVCLLSVYLIKIGTNATSKCTNKQHFLWSRSFIRVNKY